MGDSVCELFIYNCLVTLDVVCKESKCIGTHRGHNNQDAHSGDITVRLLGDDELWTVVLKH